MHARYRNGPGNGYRPNAIGMAATSRSSPEGSMRGHRTYNSEHRNYGRGGGYGRGGPGGPSKPFQPPLPPPRETDIFMEAGKLAAEYLVSKGVLPPNALSGKWQDVGLKNQVGGFLGFRSREVENVQISVDGRPSAHSRLGNATLDVGPGRRRYSDEFNASRSGNSVRETRRTWSFSTYGSEAKKELVRSVSSAERSRTSSGMEANGDVSASLRDLKPEGGKNGNEELKNSSSDEKTQEGVIASHVESDLEKSSSMEDTASKSSSFSNLKNIPSDADGEPTKESNDAYKFITEAKVTIEEKNDVDLEEKHDDNKEPITSRKDDMSVDEDDLDLVKHSRFVNVPTKARSSSTIKGSKREQVPMNEAENLSNGEISEVSEAHSMNFDAYSSTGNVSSDQNHELENLKPDSLSATPGKKLLDPTVMMEPGDCLGSESGLERSVNKKQESDEGLSGFSRSNSMLSEKSGKRPIDDDTDAREDSKRLKEWIHPLVGQFDGSASISSSVENLSNLEEQRTSQTALDDLSDGRKSLDVSLFSKDHGSSSEFMEEKQLFPGSFKTCDLNLLGTCDINENHDANPLLIFPSVIQSGKDAAPIDVDLSMSNKCTLPTKSGKFGVHFNDIEVIDLENDSAPEDQTFSNSQRRGDNVFPDLDGFNSNPHNTNEISDVQDGYGLMISELLGNESPHNSVATDLNSLHNHMALPNEEGILGDDDSIYMSLGEIPISLLGAWEQPTQDYGKPF